MEFDLTEAIKDLVYQIKFNRQEIEEIKKKLENQDKNIELVFSYLDELIEKQENPQPRKQIGFKRSDEK